MYWSALVCREVCLTNYLSSPETLSQDSFQGQELPRQNSSAPWGSCILLVIGSNWDYKELFYFGYCKQWDPFLFGKDYWDGEGFLEAQRHRWDGNQEVRPGAAAGAALCLNTLVAQNGIPVTAFSPCNICASVINHLFYLILSVFSSSCCKFLFVISRQMWK